VTVSGLERLGDEFGVGISGGRLVFNEGLGHFETTVTNWHFCLGLKEKLRIKKSKRLTTPHPSAFLLFHSDAPGSPWRVWSRVQQRRPRDQRRKF
jgi:hypothetical protein